MDAAAGDRSVSSAPPVHLAVDPADGRDDAGGGCRGRSRPPRSARPAPPPHRPRRAGPAGDQEGPAGGQGRGAGPGEQGGQRGPRGRQRTGRGADQDGLARTGARWPRPRAGRPPHRRTWPPRPAAPRRPAGAGPRRRSSPSRPAACPRATVWLGHRGQPVGRGRKQQRHGHSGLLPGEPLASPRLTALGCPGPAYRGPPKTGHAAVREVMPGPGRRRRPRRPWCWPAAPGSGSARDRNKVYLPLGGRERGRVVAAHLGPVPEIGVLVLVVRPQDGELAAAGAGRRARAGPTWRSCTAARRARNPS